MTGLDPDFSRPVVVFTGVAGLEDVTLLEGVVGETTGAVGYIETVVAEEAEPEAGAREVNRIQVESLTPDFQVAGCCVVVVGGVEAADGDGWGGVQDGDGAVAGGAVRRAVVYPYFGQPDVVLGSVAVVELVEEGEGVVGGGDETV